MKRIFLFILTNLSILLVFGTTASLLGINKYIAPYGLNLSNLIMFAALFGFGGSFLSLLMSKVIAKWSMNLTLINGKENPESEWIYSTVEKYSQQMNIVMPEVAIYRSNDMNAFATGSSKDNSLIALSTGLLTGMHKNEVEAVIGHEIAHIANGDMVTSTLLQGILNTFVIFFARIIGFTIDKIFGGNNKPGIIYVITIFVLELFFGFLASIIVAYHSRKREFSADEGGALLAGKESMINALSRLASKHQENKLTNNLKAFGINGGSNKFRFLLSSHPPIEKRIEALRKN